MKTLDLNRWFHDITITYRAPHAVFSDQNVFTPISIKGDNHVKIIFDRINSTPQLKATELYISVKPCTIVGSDDAQQTTLEGDGGEELQSVHADGHLTLTRCITIGGYILPCHNTPTPMEVCESSYQHKYIPSLGGKAKSSLVMIEMSMKR